MKVPSGQYEFPFTVRLPNELPSSFNMKMDNEDVY
jgi:hypothetical protein